MVYFYKNVFVNIVWKCHSTRYDISVKQAANLRLVHTDALRCVM